MASGSPSTVLETFKARFSTESAYMTATNWVDVAVFLVRVDTEPASSSRIAIVILEWNSENILFQEFIGEEWAFYTFVFAEALPECQWVVHRADDNRGDDLCWLQFSSREQLARFGARFELGRELMKVYHDSFQVLLTNSLNVFLPPHDGLLVISGPVENRRLPLSPVVPFAPRVSVETEASVRSETGHCAFSKVIHLIRYLFSW